MTWPFHSKLLMLLVVSLVPLMILAAGTTASDNPGGVPVDSDVARTPQDHLLSLQHRLKSPDEIDARLRLSVPGLHRIPVHIAWRKPDFVFIHVGRVGDNPAQWYWFENQQLNVYETWPKRGARGVTVTNLVPLVDGSRKRAFETVLQRAENFALSGDVALRMLQLVQRVPAEKVEVKEREKKWEFTVEARAFDDRLVEEFLPYTKERTLVLFELSHRADKKPRLAAIRVKYDTRPPTLGFNADFDSLSFSMTRERLKVPQPPDGLMKAVRLSEVDDLDSELIDSIRPDHTSN